MSSEEIRHFERKRSVTLEITPPNHKSLEEGIDLVKNQIIQPLKDDGTLSGEYSINLTGNADKLEKTREAMSGNFILAIIITYLLLAVLFQHWGFPLIIMLSVPMAAVGGVVGLWALNLYVNQPLDVLTMLGFIILIGVVVNNAILIIYQTLLHIREDSMFYRDAILESVRNRIRPIFMSTFTSIFGLMPLVVIPGAGSEIYRGIGVVILSGLFFSTVFTLLLIPCLLNLSFGMRSGPSAPVSPHSPKPTTRFHPRGRGNSHAEPKDAMTDKNQVLNYWQKFFADLLIGTFVNLFLFGVVGFVIGMIGTYSLKEIYIWETDWSGWLQWLVVITALLWYGLWGPIHGVIASIIETARGKFRQMVGGLHDLLDILVSGVLANYPDVNKSIPKEELARKFDEIGKNFSMNSNSKAVPSIG